MKRKYCLVRNQGDLDVGSFVYVVWVGSSLRESVLYTLVEEYCKDCGWYFKRWSPTVDSALDLRCKFSRLDGNRLAKPYQMISLNIRQCYQTIIDDAWHELEANRVMTPFEKYLRFRQHPDFLRALNHEKCTTLCPPSRRKYLSPEKWTDGTKAACGFILLVVLIMVDAIVSNYLITTNF